MARIDRLIEALFARGADQLDLRSGDKATLQLGDESRPVTGSNLQIKLLRNFLAEIVPSELAEEVDQTGDHAFTYCSPSGTVSIRVERSASSLHIRATPAPVEKKVEKPPAPKQTKQSRPSKKARPPKRKRPEQPPARAEAASPTAASLEPNQHASVTPSAETAEIDALFQEMVREGCSDLHLSSGCRPLFRKDGAMVALSSEQPLPADRVHDLLYSITPPAARAEFERRHDTDFSYEVPDLGRFRCNLFMDRRGAGGVFRVIPSDILTAEDLGLSEHILALCHLSKGLVVVTGPTGSGKSTTLAAMVDYINRNRAAHLITIEDPIEFVHENKLCLINQREIGYHTEGFKPALRAALREDPDIVLVGEMRDLETIEIAIETAETGHLVFGTLHTNTAASTIDRIIDQFPADRQSQIRTMLSNSLKGVVAQTLCKKKEGGRLAALEVLIVNSAVSNLIREAKTFQIPSIMQTGKRLGMVTLNEALLELAASGQVEAEEAYAKAVDREEFAKLLQTQGIRLDVNAQPE